MDTPGHVYVTRVSDMRLKCLQEEETRLRRMVDFEAYKRPLDMVTTFKYLQRVLTESDDDWPEIVAIPKKLRKRCAGISRNI